MLLGPLTVRTPPNQFNALNVEDGDILKDFVHPSKTTPGESDTGASLPQGGKAAKESSSQQPISSAIDMHVLQGDQKYHNPDPLLQFIGSANEATIIIEGQRFLGIVEVNSL